MVQGNNTYTINSSGVIVSGNALLSFDNLEVDLEKYPNPIEPFEGYETNFSRFWISPKGKVFDAFDAHPTTAISLISKFYSDYKIKPLPEEEQYKFDQNELFLINRGWIRGNIQDGTIYFEVWDKGLGRDQKDNIIEFLYKAGVGLYDVFIESHTTHEEIFIGTSEEFLSDKYGSLSWDITLDYKYEAGDAVYIKEAPRCVFYYGKTLEFAVSRRIELEKTKCFINRIEATATENFQFPNEDYKNNTGQAVYLVSAESKKVRGHFLVAEEDIAYKIQSKLSWDITPIKPNPKDPQSYLGWLTRGVGGNANVYKVIVCVGKEGQFWGWATFDGDIREALNNFEKLKTSPEYCKSTTRGGMLTYWWDTSAFTPVEYIGELPFTIDLNKIASIPPEMLVGTQGLPFFYENNELYWGRKGMHKDIPEINLDFDNYKNAIVGRIGNNSVVFWNPDYKPSEMGEQHEKVVDCMFELLNEKFIDNNMSVVFVNDPSSLTVEEFLNPDKI